MSTIRQNKVSRLLQREMGDIFQKEGTLLLPGSMVTITNAEVSPDLSIVNFYITVLGKLKPQEALEILMAKKSELRHELSHKVKHQLRIIPELRFYIDDQYEAMKRIDELLKK
jgi:ribosome-binding factor A